MLNFNKVYFVLLCFLLPCSVIVKGSQRGCSCNWTAIIQCVAMCSVQSSNMTFCLTKGTVSFSMNNDPFKKLTLHFCWQ